MPHLWRWSHKRHWSRHWRGFIMTPSQIISHLYCSLSADCREVKYWACINGVVTFGWMSEETALLDRQSDRPGEMDVGIEGKVTDNDRWGPTQSGGNGRSMTYTQPCPTLYHLCLHSTAQGLEEEEGWRSLSVPSPHRCLETSHLSKFVIGSEVILCLWWKMIAGTSDWCLHVCVCVCVSERRGSSQRCGI